MMTMPDDVRPLADYVRAQALTVEQSGGIVAFPHHWQVPAATEKAAHDSLRRQQHLVRGFSYIGFPWATLIDALAKNADKAELLLRALQRLLDHEAPGGGRRVTVTQHIDAARYANLFRAAGVTDVFWSHATHDVQAFDDDVLIHPFPLFPAQAPRYAPPESLDADREHLANFVGAYNPQIYLTNVRGVIFEDAGRYDDVHIVRRDSWHFDRTVYQEQVAGQSAQAAELAVEARRKQEYLDIMRSSWFTLCPTGSGPNSIRIFEALALASIPIILTTDLRLPGSQKAWERAAIIDDDSAEGYRRAMDRARQTSIADRRTMLKFGAQLFEDVGPNAFGELVTDGLIKSGGLG